MEDESETESMRLRIIGLEYQLKETEEVFQRFIAFQQQQISILEEKVRVAEGLANYRYETETLLRDYNDARIELHRLGQENEVLKNKLYKVGIK